MNATLFWNTGRAAVLIIYAVAAVMILQGQGDHWIVLLSALILAAHLLEIPLALKLARPDKATVPAFLAGTVLFGFFWWVPVWQAKTRSQAPG